MRGYAPWILGFVLVASICAALYLTLGPPHESHSPEPQERGAGFTRINQTVEKTVAEPLLPPLASFVDAPRFETKGPRLTELSVVLLPERTPVARVGFWGTLMDDWQVYLGQTNADGVAEISLPSFGLWEFSCAAPGFGSGRVFNIDFAEGMHACVVELQPYAHRIRLRVKDAVTGSALPQAHFSSRHQDPDVLAYQESLAALPDQLLGSNGNLDLELKQPDIAYVMVEADGYQPAAVSVFEGGAHVVPLQKLQPHSIQVLERGEAVSAQVEVAFAAAHHRFGVHAHTTLRLPDTYFTQTDDGGFASIALPNRLGHGGFSLRITSAAGTTKKWEQLQLASLPSGVWALDLAD